METTGGRRVSLSGDGRTVAISAYNSTVRIHSFDGTNWNQLGQFIDGEASGDNSGEGVSLSDDGRTVAIGANLHDNGKGHVRVHTFDGTNWNQLGQDIDGDAAADYLGASVSLSSDGRTVAVGATRHDISKGQVRIYVLTQLDNGQYLWEKLGQDIDGEQDGDNSGTAISLSSDGRTVAIGAGGNDIVGFQVATGHVRVYSFNGNEWVQFGQDIDGESINDFSGNKLSLSADGKTVAIGAIGKANTVGLVGSAAVGHVRVFRLANDILDAIDNKDKDLEEMKVRLQYLSKTVDEDAGSRAVEIGVLASISGFLACAVIVLLYRAQKKQHKNIGHYHTPSV